MCEQFWHGTAEKGDRTLSRFEAQRDIRFAANAVASALGVVSLHERRVRRRLRRHAGVWFPEAIHPLRPGRFRVVEHVQVREYRELNVFKN